MAGAQCSACKDGVSQPMPFSMAFQPIVDVRSSTVHAYEALVRGVAGENAWSVLSRVTDENRYAFDQSCRVQAITVATRLGLVDRSALLSINFLPGAVYSPAACIQVTLQMAHLSAFPLNRLQFEITEGEAVADVAHLRAIANEYRKHGLRIAIDDFGAGYANLNLLADLPCDVLKLDMSLVRNLHQRPRADDILRHVVSLCKKWGTEVVAEGVETYDEYCAVQRCGIHLMQGYLLAKPEFEALPDFQLPTVAAENQEIVSPLT